MELSVMHVYWFIVCVLVLVVALSCVLTLRAREADIENIKRELAANRQFDMALQDLGTLTHGLALTTHQKVLADELQEPRQMKRMLRSISGGRNGDHVNAHVVRRNVSEQRDDLPRPKLVAVRDLPTATRTNRGRVIMKNQRQLLDALASIYRDLGKDPGELLDAKPSHGGWPNASWFEITRADGATTWVSREALDHTDRRQLRNALLSFHEAPDVQSRAAAFRNDDLRAPN